MRTLLLIATLIGFSVANETFAQNPKKDRPDEFRVGREEAEKMRKNISKEQYTIKVSRKELMSLIENAETPHDDDAFVFFVVKADGNDTGSKRRFADKFKRAKKSSIIPQEKMRDEIEKTWKSVAAKPSILVGYIPGDKVNQTSSWLNPLLFRIKISVYDIAVVCPPPPDCDCEIME